jgi:hypothetical protein
MEIHSTSKGKIVNLDCSDKKKQEDSMNKISKYFGRFSIFKPNFEGKIRNRLTFLKEKVKKNVFEIKSLIQSLYFHRFTLPGNGSKKAIFNILKTKKQRELGEPVEEKTFQDEQAGKDYEEFFNYKYNSNSSSENNSDKEDQPVEKNKKKDIFKEVFSPQFVSLNEYNDFDAGSSNL